LRLINFILKKIQNINDVVKWRLCLGCGACAPACPEKAIELEDIFDHGIRPISNTSKCKKCGECLKVCPGIEITQHISHNNILTELEKAWGPVLEVWEGYATDHEIRYKGSSGGVVTALALYNLEQKNASSVMHIGAKKAYPLQNAVFFSRSRDEIISRSGSRYAPAPVCEKMSQITQNLESFVVIGKPCDIAAMRKTQKYKKQMEDNIKCIISIFCAGTPSTEGTYKLLDKLGVEPEHVSALRYRGYGWPGMTCIQLKESDSQVKELSYQQSWDDILSKYTQYRCRLCPDSTGQLADISCGDPWYRDRNVEKDGWSLVLVRTERGREILHKAVEYGYLKLEHTEISNVSKSQKALLERKRHLWGRLVTLRLVGIPTPKFTGFALFKNWMELSLVDKLRSFAGTMKRIITRGWKKPLKIYSSEH
jgi:coenzyme F420 hydrogenase subunit beta